MKFEIAPSQEQPKTEPTMRVKLTVEAGRLWLMAQDSDGRWDSILTIGQGGMLHRNTAVSNAIRGLRLDLDGRIMLGGE